MVGQQLTNFIDDEFRKWLCWYWQQLPDKQDTGQRHRAFLHHQMPWTKNLLDKLKSLIAPYEENFEISTAYLSQDYAPGGIHSDGFLPKFPEAGCISQTYLVPLQISGSHATIVFEETSEEAVTFNAAQGLDNLGIVYYRQVVPEDYLDVKNRILNIDVYKKYLTHLDESCLHGLTLSNVLNWQVGSAISWPREHFHCSANFESTQDRLALIMMTCNIK